MVNKGFDRSQNNFDRGQNGTRYLKLRSKQSKIFDHGQTFDHGQNVPRSLTVVKPLTAFKTVQDL